MDDISFLRRGNGYKDGAFMDTELSVYIYMETELTVVHCYLENFGKCTTTVLSTTLFLVETKVVLVILK